MVTVGLNTGDSEGYDAVLFHPIRCKRCGSRDLKCNGSRHKGRYRWYRCRGCGNRFKVIVMGVDGK